MEKFGPRGLPVHYGVIRNGKVLQTVVSQWHSCEVMGWVKQRHGQVVRCKATA